MKMRMRSKKAVVIGAMALMAAVIPVGPANATANAGVTPVNVGGAVGIGECAAVGATTDGSTMDLVVRGTATIAGATNVSIVCHVWQGTSKHGHVGGVGTAGFAAAAGVVSNFNLANYNICAEIFITTLSGGFHIGCH